MTDTPQWPNFSTPPQEPAPPAPPGPDPVPFGVDPSPDGAGFGAPGHGARSTTAIAAVVAAVMFVTGGAVGALLVDNGRSNAGSGIDAIRSPGTTPTQPSPTTPSQPSNPGSSNPDTSNPGTSAPPAQTPSDGDNTVSTGVVDIETTLANNQGEAAGTGMVISSSGLVLTNNHVIENSATIKAQIGGVGRTYNATVVGYDATDDVALLQLQNASGLATVKLGNSNKVEVGDRITAVGNALGRSGPDTVVTGVVTALHRNITVGDDSGGSEALRDMIEVNASIQPGDSGGPVLDSSNAVIGMTTAGSAGRRSASTTGYAIPIANAQSIIQQIRSGKSTSTVHVGTRGMLGVEMQPANGGRFGGGSTGATIAAVQSNSPAESAGMAAGDVIRSIGSTSVSSADDVGAALYPYHAGDKVKVGWADSNGRQHDATVTLTEGPPA